jgi:2-polyprenyl-6-methoxyphenol hydroxylase-like FAD-dependent oxidoreductase
MEALVPGIGAALLAGGGRVIDSAADVAVFGSQGWTGRVKSETHVVCARRPLIELTIRNRVQEIRNVEFVQGRVLGPHTSDDRSTVTGVLTFADRTRPVESELVVDASGRGSRAPDWLEELGYPAPREVEVRSFIGYATALARLPAESFPEGALGVLAHPNPANPRGGAVIPCDNGLYQIAALGMVHNDPPSDTAGFFNYLDQASTPILGEIARRAELVGPPKLYRLPGSRRRRFEQLDSRPEGFVVIGDALMAFNPLYGQGMSVAACSALAIKRTLESGADARPGLAAALQASFIDIVDTVFDMVISLDGQYPAAELRGVERPSAERAAYGRALSQLATEDAEAALAMKYAAHYFDTGLLATPSLQVKVKEWVASGGTVVNNNPRVVPGLIAAG